LLVSQIMINFAQNKSIKRMTTKEILRQKSAHYLPCFINECPKHQTCLHWLTGEQTQDESPIITSVNPMNAHVKAGCCELYRENKTASYARGILHLLDIIPYNQARNIKRRLIKTFSRKRYYEYRNGTRLIAPAEQEIIARICQEEGWTGEIRYDGWEEDFLW